jgi:predicted RNase H-like nuclease
VAVLGVDGWRGRWAGALLDDGGVTLLALDDVAAVLAVPGVDAVAVDMPIGLSYDGPRACDVAARRLLGRAGSSVFPAPLRPVLGAGDYAEACRLSVDASGKALSKQAWFLVPSIRTLDDALGDPPDPRVHEVHPELAFRALDERVRDPKVTARGLAQRLAALRPVMDVERALAGAPERLPAVDALDACAAAWSARRIAAGTAERVGDDRLDARGRPMRISW